MKNFDFFKDTINNTFQIRINGDVYCVDNDDFEQGKILEEILNMLLHDESIVYIKEKLCEKFPTSKVASTINSLSEAIPSLMRTSSEPENAKDVQKVVIISNGYIGKQLKKSPQLKNDEILLLDYSQINENVLDNIIPNMDFAFVDATSWAPYYIRLINQKALTWNKPWLLIGGQLSKNISIGPLFYGKETACFDCLIMRFKNNLDYSTLYSSYYNNLCSNHIVSSMQNISDEDSTLMNLLVDFTLVEYANFISGWDVPQTFRTVIEFDKKDFSLKKHILLKVPYCNTCNPKIEYDVNPWLDEICIK